MGATGARSGPVFRWLGVAGLELSLGDAVLAIAPFFTRPPLRRVLWGRLEPDAALAAEKGLSLDFVAVVNATAQFLKCAEAHGVLLQYNLLNRVYLN